MTSASLLIKQCEIEIGNLEDQRFIFGLLTESDEQRLKDLKTDIECFLDIEELDSELADDEEYL